METAVKLQDARDQLTDRIIPSHLRATCRHYTIPVKEKYPPVLLAPQLAKLCVVSHVLRCNTCASLFGSFVVLY
jgi:hypothetical protein